MSDTQAPYELDAAFERAFVTLACSRQRFYNRIGGAIDPDLLNSGVAQRAMRAAQAVARKRGTGPSAAQIVLQQLRQWMEEGRITQEMIIEVSDYFEDAYEAGLPDEDDAVEAILPILQRRLNDTAINVAMEAFGKHGDLGQAAEIINKSRHLGQANNSLGVGLENAFDEIATISKLERMPTGIPELDAALDGGPEVGTSFVFAGGTGDGKSFMLTQITSEAIYRGWNVAYVTLEVSRARTFARIMANLTGVPMHGIVNGSRHLAMERYAQLQQWLVDRQQPALGLLRVEDFTPGVTTVADVKAFVKRIEDTTGKGINVVVVDYWDRGAPEEAQKTKSSYMDMLYVFESFRIWMNDEQRWGFTASQAQRHSPSKSTGGKKQRLLDTDDGADSQNKVRVSDGWVTLNVSHDGKEVTFFVGKNRHGGARQAVGPLPTDWACGRIAPTNRAWDSYMARDELDPTADCQRVLLA